MTADRQPSLCDLIAGALVQPWPVQIGVSLDGHRAQIIAAAEAVLCVIEPHILAITVDATQRADELAAQLQQYDHDLIAERRTRLAAEAAARRAREVHRRHDCARHVNPRTPAPCANDGLCIGCAARYPCPTIAALNAEQPSACCDLHGPLCEPPSELCCSACTEANHPQHPAGVPCVLDQPKETP